MLGSMQHKHEKEAFTRPHSLVTVSIKPHLVRLKKLVMDAPAKIEPLIGTLKTHPTTRQATRAAKTALDALMSGQSWEKPDKNMADTY